jgi:hypothetical protein
VKLEQALTYVTHHSESIIQWLLFAILAISGALIARAMFSKKTEGSENSELSEALKKIMEQTAKLEAVSLDKAGPAGVAAVDTQVQTLKADLQNREAEIAKLKAAGTADPKAAEEAKALAARIQELEAKLSEYEILEDDIADLSLYKEENTRLRAELDRVKGGGAATAATVAPPAAAEKPPGGEPGDANDIVAEFAEAVGTEPVDTPPPAMIEVQDTGDPMADFESAVKAEKAVTGAAETAPAPAPASAPAPAAPAAAAAPAPAAPVAAAPKPAAAPAPAAPASAATPAPEAAAAQGEADDLFAEFSSGPSETEGGGLDTDKMMAEMAALVSMEPSTGNALEEGIDTDKMALEATSLNKS